MNKFKKHSAVLLSLLFLVFSCNCYAWPFMVGGKCIYHETFAPFEITATAEGLKGNFIGIKSTGQFDVKQALSASIYPAIYSERTEGSCAPKEFVILASEKYSRPFLIGMSDGKIDKKVKKQLKEVARTFQTVKKVWPKTRLRLCAMPDKNYTKEYAFNLKTWYERRFIKHLVNLGLAEKDIQTESSQECLRMHVFSNDQKGVWMKFIL